MNEEEKKSLLKYYVNLLIIQYHNKPKAKAVMSTLLGELISISSLAKEVESCFDIETAVGAQLDIVAKYFGVSRYYPDIIFTKKYYNFQYIPENSSPNPEGLPFQTVEKKGDGLTQTLRSRNRSPYTMSDVELRSLIKLRIICFYEEKLTYATWYEIFFQLFYLDIIPIIGSDMSITYYIDSETSRLYDVLNAHPEFLPAPAGVGVTLIGTLPEDIKEMTYKVLTTGGGAIYNRFQARLQTLTDSVEGKLKVLHENE